LYIIINLVHYNNIIHCDIKPENLLINNEGTVLIGDFGISIFLSVHDDLCEIKSGSPLFTPPYNLKGIVGSNLDGVKYITHDIAKSSDIWALGCTLFCFVHGHCPFEDDSELEIYEKIKNDKPAINIKLSKSLTNLLEKMLDKNWKSRITTPKIKKHPWVTEDGKFILMSTELNCEVDVNDVTDEDVQKAFKPAMKNFAEVFNIDI
jgi:[calcium/calmodulin-dependent protein kinase] kinase